jgi:hypothetical protein
MGFRAMAARFDPKATAYSAIENTGCAAPTPAGLRAVLATGAGDPTHVRTLFSDLSLSTLMRLAIEFEISDETLAEAYVRARAHHAASNPELDQFAAEMGYDPWQAPIPSRE